MKFFSVDLSRIEERVIQQLNVDAALKLPKWHPARFTLLYGCGAKKLRDLTFAAAYDAGPATIERMSRNAIDYFRRTVHHEAELSVFENWQRGAAALTRIRLRRENAAIAYAAMEAGITGHQEPEVPAEASSGTLTGRFVPRDPHADHPYPEEGILRD
jgi:hypothetical protein